ncbi:MAG: hypothetical protein JWO05_2997 [Gemmatimonadetes bacterium]|nr:hypothetical protein [Gemmatimonadota bacterium]
MPTHVAGPVFGATRLAEHARTLATQHVLSPASQPGWFARRDRGPLLSRLSETEQALIDARKTLLAAAASGIEVSPAGAWLLDNFFVVLEQVPEIRATLPADYYHELPKLAGDGTFAGHPRIYAIVIELIAHTDGRLDEQSVGLMIGEYQSVTELTMGELWAIPAMLRLGYLENVRRMARRASRDVADRKLADEWVTRLVDGPTPEAEAEGLFAFVHEGPKLTPAFLTRFLQQVRRRRSDFTPLLWLEQVVAEHGMSAEEAAQRSLQQSALTQHVMANSIASLRALTTIDWVGFVERASATEAILRRDPSGTYGRMTRATRDRYRHAVERIARGANREETHVARDAIALAKAAAAAHGPAAREGHVGYHLVDEGTPALEQALGFHPRVGERARKWIQAHPSRSYFGALFALAVASLAALLSPLDDQRAVTAAWVVAVLVVLLPAIDVAIAIVHQLVPLVLPPARLPRLNFERYVPRESRTAVVVPLLVPSVESVQHALEHIEVQYLANRDRQVRFALLTDLLDAATETTEGDAAIVEAARAGIEALNAEYLDPETGDRPFCLLHRARRWNAADDSWMGWERKRGKLVEFNALVAGAEPHAFSVVEGEMEWLRTVRFVITLDSDTVLPRGAAAALIGTIAHPLNRAEFDPAVGRVVRGYGILQPRVSVSLASASESRFAAVYSGHPGVDPYTTAVSDVYQDLFGEGTFTGKGIYDVEVFRQATAGRFPENTLLSHDLIEGAFARAGLVTDVEVFDDYPTRYLTSTRRAHRWIRGDWQLLRWLASSAAPGNAGAAPAPLSALSRWKIADNLRRSLNPLALLALLLAGWTVLPGHWYVWTLVALIASSAPWLVPLLFAAARPPRGQDWRAYYTALGHDASRAALQFALSVVFLPDQVLLVADAAGRTIARLLRGRRRMLEWQTASQAEGTTGHSRGSVWQRMWEGVLLGLAILAVVSWYTTAHAGRAVTLPGAGAFALIALAWLLAPEVAIVLSAPLVRRTHELRPEQRAAVLRYALRHWRYFDRFVTAESQGLVADNFQETPEPIIAQRTSPTNIGLQLLATMSAWDLGFLSRGEMLGRLERALDAMDRMPRLQGHFYNWYALDELRVLDPPYVSTVDSGNLAGHLLALAQGCLAIADDPLDDDRTWTVLDTVGVSRPARGTPVNSNVPWVGERIVAYQSAVLEVRRRAGPGERSAEEAATAVWARQRLDAAAEELAHLQLDAEEEARCSLREVASHSPNAAALVARLDAVAQRARTFAMAMDFRLLYEPKRRLFAIGYDARSGRLDESSYDLLASEARLASFIAIAKGDASAEHWFRLSRSLTVSDGATALVSWSGSMFEYLMPLLVMPARPFSLLDQTCQAAVQRQVAYGRARGVPWGISESAYNVRDRHDTYQYRAFGVPDLGLKRGLASELVVAPYATALASTVDPQSAMRNFAELEHQGALGAYGFYDALDYTRVEPGKAVSVVRNYMAHHVGMTLVALDNALSRDPGESDGTWQRRFMADAAVRAAALLLDERVPRHYVPRPAQSDIPEEVPASTRAQISVHEVDTPNTPEPHVALLGGNAYSVLLTNAGSGRSRAHGIDVLRWRADGTRDDTGQWIYIKDLTAGTVWSAGYQPVRAEGSSYQVTFATDRVVYSRRDGAVETRTEVVVIASEQAEVRRVTLVNRSSVAREIELTSYGEVVLTSPDADRAHQSFQKLFIETEWVKGNTLLASRRPRASTEARAWCAHVVATGAERVGDVGCETDRARFIGRGRTSRAPHALDDGVELSGTVGAVLDPIVALRVKVRIEAGRSAIVAFTTAVAPTRAAAIELGDRYCDVASAERAMRIARTEAEVELRDLDVAAEDVALYQELAGALLFPHEALRAPEAERALVKRAQSDLWSQGISGDLPIVLATIRTPAGIPSIRQLLLAHRYWRTKGIRSDLVILNAKPHSYAQELHDQLVAMAMASSEGAALEQPGGVFIRRADVISPEDIAQLRAVARVHIICDGVGLGGIVAANIQDFEEHTAQRPAAPRAPSTPALTSIARGTPAAESVHANGYGSLTAKNDYSIAVAGGRVPPAPWANVIANPVAGFCVTERGGGFAWAENSYFFRLTPWFNDPVSDPAGEVLYLQDVATGSTWTPTPGPAAAVGDARDAPGYDVTHAPGITTFAHERDGIATLLSMAVPPSDPVKITTLRITNTGTVERTLSLTSYVEWALGADREQTRHHLHTRHDDATGAILAQNFYGADFGGHVGFSWISEPVESFTARRDHFIGRNGDLIAPAALGPEPLSGEAGAGFDPCAALRTSITLAPGEVREVVVLLGAAVGDDAVRRLIGLHGAPAQASASIASATNAWDARLSVITARTPDAEFDALFNRWSLYQALSCRMWGRSALYQSGGAYGFRDQLQDTMAFVHAEPSIAREHILRAASRQFREGDVQHWWHEPSGRGVRTRFSDDLAWLPYVAEHYVNISGDTAIWDEVVPFLEMRVLSPGEQETYDQPRVSEEKGTLYQHCVRALEHACTVGAHGLPLMGAGDWNDGMNRVGVDGKGESVWLAWFLCATLRRFAEHAEARRDVETATRCRERADAYVAAIEGTSWDGKWYRRAYFDDGAPLGSASSEECQIDALAQSWSVLSGAGDPARSRQAMASVNERLILDDARILMLLTPPFDKTTHDPGYIKGYLPGVRENGAQYTHAALWTALATIRLGDGDRAGELVSMLNPFSHSRTAEDVERYKVEPYVIAADVYAVAGQEGRGGWTWYTGSASWSYRVALEGVLGFDKRGDRLRLDPCIPRAWKEFSIDYRVGKSVYAIAVKNPAGVSRGVREVLVDGVAAADGSIALVDDGKRREVIVTLG